MKKNETYLKYGAIIGGVSVLYYFILYVTGCAFKVGIQHYISHAIVLLLFILNGRAFSKANNGNVTFSNVFTQSMKAASIWAVIYVSYMVICTIAMPEMKAKAISMSREIMMNNPRITDDVIDTYLSMYDKYYNLFFLGAALITPFFMGAIFGVITAAVTPKKPENPFDEFPEGEKMV